MAYWVSIRIMTVFMRQIQQSFLLTRAVFLLLLNQIVSQNRGVGPATPFERLDGLTWRVLDICMPTIRLAGWNGSVQAHAKIRSQVASLPVVAASGLSPRCYAASQRNP